MFIRDNQNITIAYLIKYRFNNILDQKLCAMELATKLNRFTHTINYIFSDGSCMEFPKE